MADDSSLKELADWVDVCYFDPGATVFRQGERDEESQELWILLDGFVKGMQKPGMEDVIEPVPGLREESSLSLTGSKKGKKQKGKQSKKEKQKKGSLDRQDTADDLAAQIEAQRNSTAAVAARNEAIVPVELFATRTFGAAFGDDTFVTGDRRAYSLTAVTRSKLFKIKMSDYMALFLTEEHAIAKRKAYLKTNVTRCFNVAAGSLIHQLFPEEFQAMLQKSAVIRRVSAGETIIAPPEPPKRIVKEKSSFLASSPSLLDEGSQHEEEVEDADGLFEESFDQEQSQQHEPPEPIPEYIRPPQPAVFFLVSGHIGVMGYEEGVEELHIVNTADTGVMCNT